MQAGFHCAPVTPTGELELSGIGQRRIAKDALDQLTIRVAAFDDGQGNQALLVAFDLLYVGRKLAGQLYQLICNHHGIDEDRVLLLATHTHSAPKIADEFLDDLTVDQDCYDHLVAAAKHAIHSALHNMKPAKLAFASNGDIPTINRRVPISLIGNLHPYFRGRQVANLPNRSAQSDKDVTICAVTFNDGRYFLLANYAMHSSVFRGASYSGDHPFYVEAAIRASDPTCLGCLFLQGFAGDQAADVTAENPWSLHPLKLLERLMSKERFDRSGGAEELKLLAARIAERIQLARLEENALSIIIGHQTATPVTVERGENRTLEIKGIRIGKLKILAANGEPVAAYRSKLMSMTDGPMMTVGYLNGPIGYIPDKKVLSEGGYEPNRSPGLFGQPTPFTPTIETTFIQAAQEVITRMDDH